MWAFEPGCRNNWHIHEADKGVQILIWVAVQLLSGVGQSPAGTAPWGRAQHCTRCEALARRSSRQLIFSSGGGGGPG